MTQKPFAFLLVKFQGSNDEPMTKAEAEQMFTAAGSGTLNVVDWFQDNTHGQIDMTGNQVFGWLTLTETLADYNNKRTNGTYGRWKIIDLGRAAAVAAGIDLSTFAAVVVVTNVGVDLFGGLGGVCCTAVTAGLRYWEIHAAPSVLCQEMIHALGIYEHTRRHGSQADYQDPYDVMSIFTSALGGHHPNYAGRPIGPGLNAAFMERCGWLDHTRAGSFQQPVVLRPLHRRDLSGPLYLPIDRYYVEYRPSRRWDTGLPSVVLVHYIADSTSYLAAELRVGEEFSWGNPLSIFEPHGTIRVDAIDDNAETATISAALTPAFPVPVAGPAWSLFQSEFAGGAGWVILGGKLIPIPPRSPALQLIEAAVALVNMNSIQLDPALKMTALTSIYAQALTQVRAAYEELTEVKSPYDHLSIEGFRNLHREESTEE
jgi:hypothetical protein